MTTTADLRPCNVSLVRRPLGRSGALVVVEKHVGPYIDGINADYLSDPRSYGYPIRSRDTGAYNCRETTSGNSWSKHAYGCAIDVNWSTNGYGASHHDIPAWLVAIFAKWGFGWGGNWSGTKDWMHFSKFPNEGGDGKLDLPSEEDDLPYTEAQLIAIVQKALIPLGDRVSELERILGVGQPYAKGSNVMKALMRGGPNGTYTEELHDVYLAVTEPPSG